MFILNPHLYFLLLQAYLWRMICNRRRLFSWYYPIIDTGVWAIITDFLIPFLVVGVPTIFILNTFAAICLNIKLIPTT